MDTMENVNESHVCNPLGHSRIIFQFKVALFAKRTSWTEELQSFILFLMPESVIQILGTNVIVFLKTGKKMSSWLFNMDLKENWLKIIYTSNVMVLN